MSAAIEQARQYLAKLPKGAVEGDVELHEAIAHLSGVIAAIEGEGRDRISLNTPEGFALVPTNPATALNMGWAYLDAARLADPSREWSFSHDGYRAMIAAAPSPTGGAA